MSGFRAGHPIWALGLTITLGFGAGCAADVLPRDADANGDADIAEGFEDSSCEVSDCVAVPGPECSGDQLLTFYAACEDGQCRYPIAATLACTFGCSDGQCNPGD